MNHAIAFEGVRFSYPHRRGAPVRPAVLDDLTLAVPAGQTLALVGRSGAGKSTLLRLVNRLDEPDDGRVLVDGRDTRAWDPIALRRHVGYVLQDVGLFPHLSVARNIGLLPQLEGWPAARIADRVRDLLQLAGLTPEHAARWPDELSGGQQQRVGVARALALDPPILLMDEPFGALDPLTRLSLHREFRRIQATLRKTVIIVTHDMREAFALATRIGVIDAGRIVCLGAREDLQQSTHPFVRELMATLDPMEPIEAVAPMEPIGAADPIEPRERPGAAAAPGAPAGGDDGAA
jgi:osmoprotectant transport system ATP-binding protein